MSDLYDIIEENGIKIIKINESDFGFKVCKILLNDVQDLREGGVHKFIFDLSKVEYIDSSAIGLIISCYDFKEKTKIKISGLKKELIEFLKPMKLQMVIDFHSSLDEAKNSFA